MVKGIVTVVVIAVLALGGYFTYGAMRGVTKDVATPTSNIDVAKDTAAKVNLVAIKTGVQAYIAMNAQLPAAADQATLGGFVDPWPTNPWTQAAMKPGSQAGDYSYAPGSGSSFTLQVHLSGGAVATGP